MSAALRRVRERGSDSGLSLVELLVTMGIVSIIFAVAGAMFVSTLRQSRVATAKTNASSSARIAMEAMTRDLRVAIPVNDANPAVVSAGPRTVSFYSSRGASTAVASPTPTLVTYDITATCLRRTLTPIVVAADSTVTAQTAQQTQVCVARGGFNLDGSALFTWYPVTTAAVPSPAALSIPNVTTDQAVLGQIAAVSVSVRATDLTNQTVPPVVVAQTVTMTNLTAALQRGGS